MTIHTIRIGSRSSTLAIAQTREIIEYITNIDPHINVEFVKVRTAGDRDRTTPLEILAVLTKDEDWRIRNMVAQNPNTPLEILTILAKDEDRNVKSSVASNPKTPPEILAILAKDIYVKDVAALNPNTPKDALSERATSHLQETKRYKIKILK